MVIEQLIGSASEILQEKWILAWDGGRRWGHMTTNPAELINLVLKKLRNLPISALVKSTYIKCNALFNKRERSHKNGYKYTTLNFKKIYLYIRPCTNYFLHIFKHMQRKHLKKIIFLIQIFGITK